MSLWLNLLLELYDQREALFVCWVCVQSDGLEGCCCCSREMFVAVVDSMVLEDCIKSKLGIGLLNN